MHVSVSQNRTVPRGLLARRSLADPVERRPEPGKPLPKYALERIPCRVRSIGGGWRAMKNDGPDAAAEVVAVAPTTLSRAVRQRIFLYLGVLIVLLAFGSPYGGLIDIPISFFLKNRLHLEAHEVAE